MNFHEFLVELSLVFVLSFVLHHKYSISHTKLKTMSLSFAPLSTSEGLKQLNEYFTGCTYVFGVGPSEADAALFKLVGKCPEAATYPHAARWFNHIGSFKAAQQAKFAKTALKVSEASSKKGGDDSDDDDLFGSDSDSSDDEDLAAIAAASAAANVVQKVNWGRSQICFEIKPADAETDLEAVCDKVLAMNFDNNDRVMANLKKAQGSEKSADVLNKDTILAWGEGYEIVPVAFGICKLVVSCIVVDDCLGTDDIEEEIMTVIGEDLVQSVDVMSFNKASELKLPKDHCLRK